MTKIYCLVGPDGLIAQQSANIDPSVQTKPGWRWLPLVVAAMPERDKRTQAIEGPFLTVRKSSVVQSYTVREKTAQEIKAADDEKVSKAEMLDMIHDLRKRVNLLENK